MTRKETRHAAFILREHNRWRRGEIEKQPATPTQIGNANDAVLEAIKKYDEALGLIAHADSSARHYKETARTALK